MDDPRTSLNEAIEAGQRALALLDHLRATPGFDLANAYAAFALDNMREAVANLECVYPALPPPANDVGPET